MLTIGEACKKNPQFSFISVDEDEILKENLNLDVFLFNKPLKSYGSLYFRTFSMNKSKYHTFANFGTMQVKLIEPIFKRPCTTFHNVIATSSALQK